MDITEGKLTLMVIHTLRKATPQDKEELTKILSKHTDDKALRMKAIHIINKYGSIEYAKNLAATMVRQSWEQVDNLLPPSEAKETLRLLANYLIERKL